MTEASAMTLADRKLYQYCYVARQPIFDNQNNTYGYELLFRNGESTNIAEIDDNDYATLSVATCGFIACQENLDQRNKIFINFTENLIMEQAPRGLPPTVTVIEILENISPSKELLQEIITLKQDGYTVAVDDYEGNAILDEFLDLADIIKVDILNKNFDQIKEIYEKIKDKKSLKLAEKVEDQEMLNFLKSLGFDLYQGFFFAKPENLTAKRLQASQITKLRTLKVINDPDLSPDALIDIIGVDPGITYRLLRYINSVAFGFSIKIDSVSHAVTLLGIKRLKYWIRMAVMSDIVSDKKTPEIYLMALNRGKFLEELTHDGIINGVNPDTMFLYGMLSLIDAMLNVSMDEVIDHLPLSKEILSGYVSGGCRFYKYLQLVKAIEKADTNQLVDICSDLSMNEKDVADASIRSTAWINSIARAII